MATAGYALLNAATNGIQNNTKQVFLNATDYVANSGDYRVRSVGATGTFRFTFSIPFDYTTLISVELIGFPGANGTTQSFTLNSDYGAIGEQYNVNSESNSITKTFTNGELMALDLSSVFSALSANDFCGVQVTHNSIGTSIDYIGILLKYN